MAEVRYRIQGGNPLRGTAVVQGAKNAVLPMIGAALLAEHGRTVLVAATSGISAVIAPDGSLRWTTNILTPAIYDHGVAIRNGRTLATRLGALPEWLLTAAAGGALTYVLAAAITRRRTQPARRKETQSA